METLFHLGWAREGLCPHLRLRQVSTVGIWKNHANACVALVVVPSLFLCWNCCLNLPLSGSRGCLALRSHPAARISVLRCTLACGHCNRDLSRVQRIPVSLRPSPVSVGPPVTWEQLLGICRVSCGTCWAKAAGGVWRKVSCGFLMGASSVCGVPLRMCVCCLPLVTLHGATSGCAGQRWRLLLPGCHFQRPLLCSVLAASWRQEAHA